MQMTIREFSAMNEKIYSAKISRCKSIAKMNSAKISHRASLCLYGICIKVINFNKGLIGFIRIIHVLKASVYSKFAKFHAREDLDAQSITHPDNPILKKAP